jgi:hypothetical protein
VSLDGWPIRPGAGVGALQAYYNDDRSSIERRPAKSNLFRPLFSSVRVRRRVATRVPSIWVRAVRVG